MQISIKQASELVIPNASYKNLKLSSNAKDAKSPKKVFVDEVVALLRLSVFL